MTGRFISNESVRFLAWGPPKPKARPRLGKQGRWYTPKDTVVYENHIAWVIHQKSTGRPITFGDHPVWIHAEFFMPNDRIVDGDNLLKSLLDGCMKGGLFDDDGQVRDFQCLVFYGCDLPRTMWEVGRLDELQSRYEEPDPKYDGRLPLEHTGNAQNIHDHGS